MWLIRGWKKKTGKGQQFNKKYFRSKQLIPIIQNILLHKCEIQNKDLLGRQSHRLISVLQMGQSFSFYIEVTINFFQNLIRYSGRLMKNNTFYIIPSKDLRINFMHKLLDKRQVLDQFGCTKIDKQTGLIQIYILVNYSLVIMNDLNYIKKEIQIQIKKLAHICRNKLKDILMEINYCNAYTEQLKIKNKDILNKIQKHIFFSQNNLGLTQKQGTQKSPNQKKLRKRQKITKHILNIEEDQCHKQVRLYGYIPAIQFSLHKQAYKMEQFYKYLQIPFANLSTSPQNIYNFNEISIKNPQKLITQQLPAQYNSIFRIAHIFFNYSVKKQMKLDQNKEQKDLQLNKLMLIKMGKNDSVKSWNKIIHEKNIVRTLNRSSSPYVIKYYISSQQNFIFKKSLMIEYNPLSDNLSQHLLKNHQSLSLNLKMHLLIHISNSLRFLQSVNIVHMDLNPKNIVLYDGLLPKLIDFGESYQKEVIQIQSKQKNYAPGFTLPYCPPQVFTKKTFSSMQDVFSFGMILFRMITGTLPYFACDSLIQFYRVHTYHSRFMFAAQTVEDIAYPQVVNLLLQLFAKCIQKQEDSRCAPIWCTIVLRQILHQLFY